MIQWLRNNRTAAIILTILRVYLGYTWLMAGIGKVTGGFETNGFLNGAIGKAEGAHPAVQNWWAVFLETVALPNHELFTFVVMWGEVLVGLGLIVGLFTNAAALGGIIMNFAFLFSGTTSTNPQMVLLTIFVLIAGLNAGKYGLDRWVLPLLQKQVVVIKNRRLAHQ
ncbi:DoxX family protein [Halobacillus mangrovi]|uniref:Crp/Fnr family transcriptional regulator n=1 Tax=Halobacillus mangrovi TaxID=402384 RepID=A0A1W5ZWP1_9BACI|nr:DoxX family protein [Halobacillus mangrovi]ARI77677.1 Crp/Fnr family transcriptional regulator [Halobacillus mangrovi]